LAGTPPRWASASLFSRGCGREFVCTGCRREREGRTETADRRTGPARQPEVGGLSSPVQARDRRIWGCGRAPLGAGTATDHTGVQPTARQTS
jgi:hypothetical protein